MRETKHAEVTIRMTLPYVVSAEDSGDLEFFKTRARSLEQDDRFLASWYDFDYDPESGNCLTHDEERSITVQVNP